MFGFPGLSNTYYNANLANKENIFLPARFEANHSTPIVNCGSDNYLIVTRFYIPASGIPLFNFFGSGKDYWISVGTNLPSAPGIYSEKLLYDESWNQTPLKGAVWSYAQFLSSLNVAMAKLMTFLTTLTAPSKIWSDMIWYFDTTSKLFKCRMFLADAFNIKIYMNDNLYRFFPTFPAKELSLNSPNKADYQLIVDFQNPDNLRVAGRCEIITEINCTYAWNSLVRIYLISSGLCTKGEIQYNPYGENQSLNIITDFEPIVNGDVRGNDVYQYVQAGEYRRLDIQDNSPIRKIDLQLFYEDKWGNVYPIYITPNSFMSIKLLFQTKIKNS